VGKTPQRQWAGKKCGREFFSDCVLWGYKPRKKENRVASSAVTSTAALMLAPGVREYVAIKKAGENRPFVDVLCVRD
jgi:hypothetical protein